jgi:hypothetical protein
MMTEKSSDNVRNLQARVTEAGEALGERVQSATAATASAAERPLMVALVGFALGYLASLWIHGRGGKPGRTADDKASAKAPSA